MSGQKPSRGDSFLANWPAVARGVGLILGSALTVGVLAGETIPPEAFAFAGGLIVAPNIAGAQDKRNGKREE
jgi:hypothetical protein